MTKRNVFALILLVFTALWMAFIFGNSLADSARSDKASSAVTDAVNDKLINSGVEVKPTLLRYIVRKSAHAIEFSVLGALSLAAASLYAGVKLRLPVCVSCFCAAVAAIDECLQYFVPGRSCELRDFAIDTVSAVLTIFVLFAILYFIKAFKAKRRRT